MCLVVDPDILCDDSTAHIVGHYITVGSENAAPWLGASARTYNVIAPCFALVVDELCSLGSSVIEVVDDVCTVESTVGLLDSDIIIRIAYSSVCPLGSPAEL